MLFDLLKILGALALFIYGMKIMSDGIQKASGSALRRILRNMTKKRWLGLLTGVFTTAAVQSSSATTVMTVSFVNAGLLTLMESAGVMMGANIGTTITGWMSLLEFKVSIHEASLPLFLIGVPLFFSKNERFKYWGEFVIGFAVLFMGLNLLTENVPDVNQNIEVFEWVRQYTSGGFFTNLLFIFIGAIITLVIQSSSAAMILTITMCVKGWIPIEIAAALILGENIGTVVTAEVAAIVANIHAKRSARIHSLFNIIGVIWILILLPYFLKFNFFLLDNLLNIKPQEGDPSDIAITLASFHSLFNICNALLLIGFTKYLVWLAIKTVPQKNENEKKSRLKYISNNIKSSEMATLELKKDTAHLCDIISRMSSTCKDYYNSRDEIQQMRNYEKLIQYEEITDDIRNEITEYVTKISKQETTTGTSVILKSVLNITNELERIGDIYQEIAEAIHSKITNSIWFNPTQRDNINSLMSLTDHSVKETLSNLRMDRYADADLTLSKELKEEFNIKINQLKSALFEYTRGEDVNSKGLVIYNTLMASLGQVQYHVNEINQSLAENQN